MANPPPPQTNILDLETIDRVSKGDRLRYLHLVCLIQLVVGRQTSELLYMLANEPSVGLHHVSDHIRRNVPKVSLYSNFPT